ncbi:Uncharacterized protein FWK35_00001734 [Aphis craccivora]|uniref:Uncharacterized protein n=1 Tax=Aphis craccivora TaxID=307492 RepID=A0A6G0ZIM2_APHCR|nr:Uncharacterized protein FWK35_00001734 [Aphis craccivora]
MSQAIEQLEQQQSILKEDNKRLSEANDELLEITKKQKLTVNEDVPTADEPKVLSAQDITNQYRKSIYKKLADLENQLLNSPTPCVDDLDFDEKDAKKMLKLKVQIHSLLQENKSLKDRLSDFQNLHDQVMSEIRSKKIGNRNNQQQGNNATTNSSPAASGSLDKNNVQPLQVNVVDGDADEIKDE